MSSTQFIVLSLSTLAGGILGSFGLNALIQRTRFRFIVQRWRGWGLALSYVVVILTVVVGLTTIVRRVLVVDGTSASLESPAFFFTFGFLAGLPFTLPTVTSLWRAARFPKNRREKAKPATRQQRQAFVEDLEKQMREYVDPARTVHLELQGETGDVLHLGEGFTRQEGERLVLALRADLMDMGIGRVEGDTKGNNWWVRVKQEKTK